MNVQEIERQRNLIYAQPNTRRFMQPVPRDLRQAGLTPFEEGKRESFFMGLTVFGIILTIVVFIL